MIVKHQKNGQYVYSQFGLGESQLDQTKDYPALKLLQRRSWMTRCYDHIVEYLKYEFAGTGVEVSAKYPQIATKEELTQLKLPKIMVCVLAGSSRDVGIGMDVWGNGRQLVKGYKQTAYIGIDVWAGTQFDASNIASLASEFLCGRGKVGYLLRKGFQKFESDFSSKSATAFEYWDSFIYDPSFINIPLYRHFISHTTCFEVVWKHDPEAYGIITSISLAGEDTYSWEETLGIRMDYLYLEDKYLNWFDIGV
jgi:hypothetical protein